MLKTPKTIVLRRQTRNHPQLKTFKIPNFKFWKFPIFKNYNPYHFDCRNNSDSESRIIEDASARPPHPEMASPANSLPAFLLGVYAWFLAKYSCILQAHWPHTILIMRSIFDRFFNEFRSIFGRFRCFLPFGMTSASMLRKVALRRPTLGMKHRDFSDFQDPAGTSKSIKNGPASGKVRPETSPEAFFIGFSCRCRSESLFGPILARFFTENHA